MKLSISLFSLFHLSTASPSPPQPDNNGITPRQWYIGQPCTNTLQNNIYGTCQTTSTCWSRGGTADTNPDCPGPDNVQCCILDDCVNGASGVCLDTRQWNCRDGGGWNSGNHCPGPDTYLCCQGTWWIKGGLQPV